MAFRIPDKDKMGFKKLAALSDAEIDKLNSAINEVNITGKITVLARSIEKSLKMTFEDALDITRAIFSSKVTLLSSSDTKSEDFFSSIASSLIRENILDESGKKELISRLDFLIIKNNHIGDLAQAAKLYTKHERIFLSADVITDMRPLFGTMEENSEMTCIIYHNLEISIKEDGNNKTIYLSLDSDDLIQFKKSIEMAINKERTLEEMSGEKLKILRT
jgi:hypothetical protein